METHTHRLTTIPQTRTGHQVRSVWTRRICHKKQINNLYTEKAKGAQVRSRINWVENSEKNNAYFLGLEKTRQSQKVIKKLKLSNGDITESSETICKEIKEFYSDLYTSQNIDKHCISQYLDAVNVERKVSDKDRDTCEGNFSFDECRKAVFSMKKNKSPGSDGISVEFYQQFWDFIGEEIVNSSNEGYDKGELSHTQKHGIVSLISKKDDPLLLKNWRPITLLNIDYKIAAYALATRLKKVMPNIINTDQNGYIKDRFIGYNIRLIQDIIDHSEKFNVDSCILFLDFTKAFDTIEWDFMLPTLKKFGFGESFRHWGKSPLY